MKLMKMLLLMTLLIFLTGCAELGLKTAVSQTIHRDQKIDTSVTISASSTEDLNAIKEGFDVNPEFAGKVKQLESDGKETYSFTGMNAGDELFMLTGDEKNKIFLSKNTYSLKKEFKFPFYKYTYMIDLTGAEPGNDPRKEIEEKCKTLASLKEQLAEATALGSEKLAALKSAATQEEKQALLEEIRTARDKEVILKSQAGEISSAIQCEEKAIKPEEEFNGAVYIIEGFGSVSDTNGEKLDGDKVRFNIPADSKKVYYATYRDLFISNWIGSIF